MDDDAELAARAARDDDRAFSVLVSRHERRLRAFLARVAGPGRTDDLAQEAFLRAWRFRARFDGTGGYAGWLLRIGWRVFLDAERARARHRIAAIDPPDRPAPGYPDDAIDIARALAALDPAERACLVLCVGQGWSHAEAAAILDMPLGSLKSRLARATRRARAMLEAGA